MLQGRNVPEKPLPVSLPLPQRVLIGLAIPGEGSAKVSPFSCGQRMNHSLHSSLLHRPETGWTVFRKLSNFVYFRHSDGFRGIDFAGVWSFEHAVKSAKFPICDKDSQCPSSLSPSELRESDRTMPRGDYSHDKWTSALNIFRINLKSSCVEFSPGQSDSNDGAWMTQSRQDEGVLYTLRCVVSHGFYRNYLLTRLHQPAKSLKVMNRHKTSWLAPHSHLTPF